MKIRYIVWSILFLYNFNVFAFEVVKPPEVKKGQDGDKNKIITILKMKRPTKPLPILYTETGEAVFRCSLVDGSVANCSYSRESYDFPSPGYVNGGHSKITTSIKGNCCIYFHESITVIGTAPGEVITEPTNRKFRRCCDDNGDESDLLVKLGSFKIEIVDNKTLAYWTTVSERHNSGMNLWCAQMHSNQFQEITQLNSELIPSKAILPNYGAFYSSIDYPYVNTDLKPGVQHCALEDIDTSGQCTLHCDQIDTVVVGEDPSVINVNLNELNAKAIALCHQYKDELAETGQEGICLDQLLMSL